MPITATFFLQPDTDNTANKTINTAITFLLIVFPSKTDDLNRECS